MAAQNNKDQDNQNPAADAPSFRPMDGEGIPPNPAGTPVAQGAPISIVAQYVRDISFENPNAPATLWPGPEGATGGGMDVGFSMGAKKVDRDNSPPLYEVTLTVNVTARRGDQVIYIAEIEYAVLTALHNVPEEQHHSLLLIKVPEYAFPFVRQIVADLTQQGGFMPLLLTPVDFRAMYLERFGNKAASSPAPAASKETAAAG